MMRIFRCLSSGACLAVALHAGAGAVEAQIPAREMVAITGQVVDVTTGEPIPGVTVVVEGTGLRFETNIGGEFTVGANRGWRISAPAYPPGLQPGGR